MASPTTTRPHGAAVAGLNGGGGRRCPLSRHTTTTTTTSFLPFIVEETRKGGVMQQKRGERSAWPASSITTRNRCTRRCPMPLGGVGPTVGPFPCPPSVGDAHAATPSRLFRWRKRGRGRTRVVAKERSTASGGGGGGGGVRCHPHRQKRRRREWRRRRSLLGGDFPTSRVPHACRHGSTAVVVVCIALSVQQMQ